MPDYQSAVLLNNSNKRTCRQSEIVIQQTGNNRISTPPVTHLSYRVAIRASIGGTQHNLITLNRCRCRNPLSGIVGNFKTLQWRGSRRCNVGNTIQRSRVRIRIIIGYDRARSLRIIGFCKPVAVPFWNDNTIVPTEACFACAISGPLGMVLPSDIARYCAAMRAPRISLPSGCINVEVPLSVSSDTVIATLKALRNPALLNVFNCANRTFCVYW